MQSSTDAHVETLTSATFDEEVGRAGGPILVVFWADGCGPCLALAPVLEEIAQEQLGRLRVGSVRLDDAPDLAARFEIMSLPTLIVFCRAEQKRRLTGAASKLQLLGDLQDFLR